MLSLLQYKPGCILDKNNSLDIQASIYQKGRLLNETSDQKGYGVKLNVNSNKTVEYRGKLMEEGTTNFFKELSSTSDVSMYVYLPYHTKCSV